MYRIETSTDLAKWAAFSPALNYVAPTPLYSTTSVLLPRAAKQRRFFKPVIVLPLSE